MHIQWNTVTWYSKLFAVVVFIATFFLAFNLGVLWEQTHIETSIMQTPLVDGTTSTNDGTSTTDASGTVCGGFIKGAPTCPSGYHCQLGPIADKGGTCVADSATASSTSPIPSDMLVVTIADQNTTVHLTKNERFAIKFGDLSWSLSFTPADAVTRVPNSISTDGYQGVYEANKTGTVDLVANGRAVCKPGQACPMFIQQVRITLVVSN